MMTHRVDRLSFGAGGTEYTRRGPPAVEAVPSVDTVDADTSDSDSDEASAARSEQAELEQSQLRRLRPMALKRLKRLMETAGELPPNGEAGVFLPPFPLRFLADELGCRPQLVSSLLNRLTEEGVLLEADGRFQVPNPKALSQTHLS